MHNPVKVTSILRSTPSSTTKWITTHIYVYTLTLHILRELHGIVGIHFFITIFKSPTYLRKFTRRKICQNLVDVHLETLVIPVMHCSAAFCAYSYLWVHQFSQTSMLSAVMSSFERLRNRNMFMTTPNLWCLRQHVFTILWISTGLRMRSLVLICWMCIGL